MHPLTLRFPSDALEAEFRDEIAHASRRTARITLLVVASLYLVYGVLDRAVLPPDVVETLWWVRVLVVAALTATAALTWHPAWVRLHTWATVVAAVVATAGLLAIMVLQGPGLGLTIYSGIGVVALGAGTLFRLRVPVVAPLVLAIGLAWLGTALAIGASRDELLTGVFFVPTCIVLGVLAAYTIELYARRAFLHEREIQEERARAERLLLNVLPATVAERLKHEPGPIAERHPEATVLFADIAGFTPMSSDMAPEDLVAMLDGVFTDFDEIAAAHGLEKIKTIGDAYMAVAGVPEAAADHAERVAEAALEMRRRAPLPIRIGIDTGPVVAGVIGRSKFIYDLWGDAVTTASRMESHGLPGEIHVTARVRQRLAGRYAFRPRGEIEVKGKGRMETWLMDGD